MNGACTQSSACAVTNEQWCDDVFRVGILCAGIKPDMPDMSKIFGTAKDQAKGRIEVRPFYISAPFFLCNGEKIDFVCLGSGTTMPGRHSGDQVHKVKKNAAPSFVYVTALGTKIGWKAT